MWGRGVEEKGVVVGGWGVMVEERAGMVVEGVEVGAETCKGALGVVVKVVVASL